MLKSLQAGRAIAALMVVFYHLSTSIWGVAKYFPHQFAASFSFANSGVQFFFVLSGFIIFYIHRDDINQPAAFFGFLRKRFIRIYLPYWIVLAVVIPVALSVTRWGEGHETEPLALFTSFFLLPFPLSPILHVAWTLKHEVFFYAVFALCIVNARVGVTIMVAWQIGCAVALPFGEIPFPLNFVFSPNNILFGIGMVTAYLVMNWRIPAPRTLMVAGIVLFFATGLHSVYAKDMLQGSVYILGFGVASAIAMIGAVTAEKAGLLPVPKLLVLLGDASYAIYLIHFLVLTLGMKILFATRLSYVLPETVSFSLLFAVAVVVGVAFHLLIERPALALVFRRPSVAR